MWFNTILEAIGNTPLVKLNKLATDLPCTVLAKVEFFNPGGSVKDRIALKMIEDAEKAGKLKPGGTIIEGTSGNTGAGLAIVAIARGYKCIFTTTDKQSQEKVDVLRALGAEVIVCPTNVAPEDPRSYYSVARRLSQEIPNAIYPNQYDNPSNAQAHYETTGPELWAQTDGKITHYIAGAGTGGTISGTAKYLKEQNPALKVIGVDPYGSVYYKYYHEKVFDYAEIYPYITEGVGEDILAGNMAFELLDDYVRVTDKASMQMTRRLSREEGLFVGGSCGMAMAGALQWLEANRETLKPEDVVVVLLPDSGFRYLSKIFNDRWMEGHGFLEKDPVLTAGEIIGMNSNSDIVFMQADQTVQDAISAMGEHGISQIPVQENGAMVGSLTERKLLNLLVESPEARSRTIRDVMGASFPIIARGTGLDQLSGILEKDAEAVLVRREFGAGFDILTRSDLLRALARRN